MKWPERLLPRTITAQITSLTAISVLLGISLVVAIIWFLFDPPSRSDSPTFAAARINEITKLVRDAHSPAEIETILAIARRSEFDVKRVALVDLVPIAVDQNRSLASRFVMRPLASQSGIELLDGLRDPTGSPEQVIAKLDDRHALIFDLALDDSLWPIFLTPTALWIIIVMLSMLLLSIYAVRWVVAPLADVANAAASFGRWPQEHETLMRRGPSEILQVTDALNDMRIRIRALLDDRTRMLAAISHDLRTPFTRLRLRAERISCDDLRTAMLNDLTRVDRMLDETLEYLRDNTHSETLSRIDLPSFLQTICSEFSDMGHSVRYAGPVRLSYACRCRALSRAVTNIIENATKHASSVTVTLGATSAVEIEVCDNGPGIPATLYDKVFEPFFKADSARLPASGGFGLGLSIARDIIEQHDGDIEMQAGEPTGLRVRILLPPN